MPKANKSSASAGTRKKNAKKAQKKDGEDGPAKPQKLQRGQKKLSKAQQRAQPKIKQYVPPPKPPAPPVPDPLDGQGLARTLPAELVVVLRRLGKKDDVTRRKGLDDLREWVVEVQRGDLVNEEEIDREIKEVALLSAAPVWLHNLASLLQSPFHRSSAIQLHADLLAVPSIRQSILDTLSLGLLPSTQGRDILGSWLVAALEEGRRAGGSALRSWNTSTSWSFSEGDESSGINLTEHLSSLTEYFALSILDPASLHDDIHPAPVASSSAISNPQIKGGKNGKGKAVPAYVAPIASESTTEDLELASELWARYRVGGLTGLAWLLQQLKLSSQPLPDGIIRLIHNPALWSSISSLPSSEESPAFGYQQPPVRRAAYAILGILVEQYAQELEKPDLLELLAACMLGDCWQEKEATVWEVSGPVVVKVLSKHRQLWQLALESQSSSEDEGDVEDKQIDRDQVDEDQEDESENDAQDDDEDEEDIEKERNDVAAEEDVADSRRQSVSPTHASRAFQHLLEFIASICPTIPHRTYPLLLVIISTIPPSILPLDTEPSPALKDLFAHLWSPVDARLLSTHSLPGQPSAFQAFLRDAVDCMVYLIGKSHKTEEGRASATWLVKEQLGGRVWAEGVLELGGRSAGRRAATSARPEQEATMFGQALTRLLGISPDLTQDLLQIVTATTLQACSNERDEKKAVALLPRILNVLKAAAGDGSDERISSSLHSLISLLASECANAMWTSVSAPSASKAIYIETLVEILKTYSHLVEESTAKVISDTIESSSPQLAQAISPDLFVSLLNAFATAFQFQADEVSAALWHVVHDSSIPQDTRFALTKSLLASDSALVVPSSLDMIAEEATHTALGSADLGAISVAVACVINPNLSAEALHTILALVSTAIHDAVYDLLTLHSDAQVPVAAVDIFSSYAKVNLSDVVASGILSPALVAIHHLVVLLPRLREAAVHVPSSAVDTWKGVDAIEKEEKRVLRDNVLSDLASLLQDVSCRIEPSILVDVALVVDPSLRASDIAQQILPDSSHIQQLVAEYTSNPPDSGLSIIDPLIPYISEEDEEPPNIPVVDSQCRSKAARLAEAALAVVRSDRQLASTNPTLLQTILSARVLAQDALSLPGASRGFLAGSVPTEYLSEVIREAEGALSFSLTAFDDVPVTWHKATVETIKKDALDDHADFLQRFFYTLAKNITVPRDDVAARIFRDVLERLLRQSGAGEAEAEVWLNYGMSQISSNPTLATVVILAVRSILLDSKPYVTAQNRLANHLSGISAAKANVAGIPALRLLIASSPPLDSASVFLPQQRALFVIRHISSWLTSEEAEDIDEEVEIRIAELYAALAPIVQDVAGSHWDSIFDLIETGLEAGGLDDKASLTLLYHCLVLLRTVRDLCETNKSLRATWTSKKTHLGLVFKLFLQCRDASSVPMQMVQDLLLNLLTDVTEDIVGDNGLPELSNLLGQSSSSSVQTTAYRLLTSVVKRKTFALVLEVEASVAEAQEGHQTRTIDLPEELLKIAIRGAGLDWHEDLPLDLVLGQLLAWMAILDHFDDASRTLRWAYLDQLHSSDLLASSLLPMLFAILGVSEVGAWNFPASQFAVDEFYTDLLQPEELADLAPLASHVFYRALVTIPTSLRTYYESLRDRQLSMSMLAFVARHFSPVIIALEFSALREPGAMAQLTEEGLNVRIAQGGGATVAASAGASEAIASYVVDEQPMEIGIRLPAEFPLRGVEIRDLKRVGVPENKWRGWLMSVQQTITSRNGLILEALTVFKKNVSLHFEGAVECAICYSIISLTDRTLPTKPCRTCKNRFHASCLYKWFNSSHSSSCPLCRALF